MATWCYYHSADLDGKCSAALILRKIPSALLCGVDYGRALPSEDEISDTDTVYMVDFSLQPFDRMLELNNKCNLIWIDHHKTAIEDHTTAGSPIKGLQRIGIGACALVHEYLFPGAELPYAVRLLAEYDVWNIADPNVFKFQHGMRLQLTEPHDTVWNTLFDRDKSTLHTMIIEDGARIIMYQRMEDKKTASSLCFPTVLDGIPILAANRTHTNSEFFSTVDKRGHYKAVCLFGWYAATGKWKVSLYNMTPDVNDIDLGAIAKKYGGGGHKGAAGFTCDVLPFKLNGRKT